jgi:hypothetical protein
MNMVVTDASNALMRECGNRRRNGQAVSHHRKKTTVEARCVSGVAEEGASHPTKPAKECEESE